MLDWFLGYAYNMCILISYLTSFNKNSFLKDIRMTQRVIKTNIRNPQRGQSLCKSATFIFMSLYNSRVFKFLLNFQSSIEMGIYIFWNYKVLRLRLFEFLVTSNLMYDEQIFENSLPFAFLLYIFQQYLFHKKFLT